MSASAHRSADTRIAAPWCALVAAGLACLLAGEAHAGAPGSRLPLTIPLEAAASDSTPAESVGDAVAPDSTAPDSSTRRQHEAAAPDTMRALDDAFRNGHDVEGRPIRSIEIVALDVYEPVPSGRLAGFYRTANALHVRTRIATVRSQLVFGVGDAWSESRGRELARNLRALNFLTPQLIEAKRAGDSVAVRIVTRDLWTTSPEFQFESSGGKRYGALAFTEKNLAGYGKALALVWRHDPVGKSRTIAYLDPNVGGSHARLELAGGDGSDGAVTHAMLGIPYWKLDAMRSYGMSFDRVTSSFVLYENASEIGSLNRRIEEAELWWGTGALRDSIVQRVTWSLTFRDKRLGPTITSEPIPPDFQGVEENNRIRRLNAEVRLWRPNYVERIGVDQMGVIEDFDIGHSIALKAGYAPGWAGGETEGYGRAAYDGGIDTRFGFGLLNASIESRLRISPRETIQRVDARWIAQYLGRQTFVVAARYNAGLAMDRDFELTAGGLNGLRAYPVHAVAGRRMWRLNAENRWQVGRLFGQFLTIGAVGFVDAARAWGAGSGGAGWFVDAGTGLRLTAPQWTLGRVLRIDLAWPVEPSRDARREPVWSLGSSQAF